MPLVGEKPGQVKYLSIRQTPERALDLEESEEASGLNLDPAETRQEISREFLFYAVMEMMDQVVKMRRNIKSS